MAHEVTTRVADGIELVELRDDASDLVATFVPGVGMVGASLRHRGEELLFARDGLAGYAEQGTTFGLPLLHPWANRLGAWAYAAAGQEVRLDPDSPLLRAEEHGLPLHGVRGPELPWRLTQAGGGPDAARLEARLDYDGDLLAPFPFPHELAVLVELRGLRLEVTTTLTARDRPVPLAFGWHPWLTLPGLPRAEWEVELPERVELHLDDRGLPDGRRTPQAAERLRLADRAFDDHFALPGGDRRFAVAGGGRRLAVEVGEGYTHAQVYATPDQDVICFEPMASPVDALRTGEDLRAVQPGASAAARFAVEVSG
jgi:galactose mutarotase-like enzyme